MNEKDIQLSKELATIIGKSDPISPRIATVSTPSINISRVNLILLRALLDELKTSGIFITIDRPHQYIEHLLRIHGISNDGLTFIDMISAFGGDSKRGLPGLRTARGPFSLTDLLELIKLSKVTKDSAYTDILRLDFLMFDNISSLLVYNSYDSVRKFLKLLVGLIKRSEGTFVAFVIDPDNWEELFRDLSRESDLCLSVSDSVSVLESKEAQSAPAAGARQVGELRGAEPTSRGI